MSTQLAQAQRAQNSEVLITVLSGPESGVVYKLLNNQITLGRAQDNDIVLQDPKASRHHAKIENQGAKFVITDLGSQNGIMVNNQIVTHSDLKPGDLFMVGSTQMKFGPPQSMALVNAAPPVLQAKPGLPATPRPKSPLASPQPWSSPSSLSLPKKINLQDKTTRNFIVGGVIIAVLVVLSQVGPTRRQGISIKDDAALQEEIDQTIESNEKKQEEISKKGLDTQQYLEANAFYMRGFREYREGNFPRSIQNFEAALALYPSHPLAKRYLERSRLKLNELITAALERGERAFQLQQYNKAKSEYKMVLFLTGDQKSKSGQLAEKRLEAIRLIQATGR
ncbi:MAG: FHA domain-containing protein [Oligoflexia bacterium]|nr:FHA domain-containing protein [Oligoflexia bacterium]